MSAFWWSCAKPVAGIAFLVAAVVLATRPGTRRALWSLRARLTAWDGTSDDAVAPAGGDEVEHVPNPEDEAVARELEAVASALRDCGDEVRGGCDCEDCVYIRDVLIAICGRVSDDDRDLLAAYGITWDREVAS